MGHMSDYQPGVYVKGDQVRTADTRSDAVAAVFDGFKLQEGSEQPDEQPEDEGQTPDPTPTPDETEPTGTETPDSGVGSADFAH